jgi:hypothetical protein
VNISLFNQLSVGSHIKEAFCKNSLATKVSKLDVISLRFANAYLHDLSLDQNILLFE